MFKNSKLYSSISIAVALVFSMIPMTTAQHNRTSIMSAVANESQESFEDSAYSWWVHPLAAEDSDGRTWFGSVSSNGEVHVNIDGNRVFLDQVEADDHNAPAIALHSTKDALVFNTRHHQDNFVRYRTVSPNGEVGEKQLLNVGRPTTYVQALTYNDTIFLLTRGTTCRWFVFITDDWGKTWTSAREFLNGCAQGNHVYVTSGNHSAGYLYRLAAYGHPVQSNWRSIDYGYVDLRSGYVREPGNKFVADLRTGLGLPITQGDMASIYTPPNGSIVRMLDLGTVAGMPTVIFAEWDLHPGPEQTKGPARYRTIRYESEHGWVSTDVGVYAGASFWETSNYLPGAAIDANGDLHVANEDGLTRWTWSNNGWADPYLETPEKAIRPYWIRGTNDDLVWQKLNHYGHFVDYDITTSVIR